MKPIASNLHSLVIEKQAEFKGTTQDLPPGLMEESEAVPFLSVSTFEDDKKTFLKNSGESEQAFLTLLLEEFRFVASQNPADIGEIRDPRFLLDIIFLPQQIKNLQRLELSTIG